MQNVKPQMHEQEAQDWDNYDARLRALRTDDPPSNEIDVFSRGRARFGLADRSGTRLELFTQSASRIRLRLRV